MGLSSNTIHLEGLSNKCLTQNVYFTLHEWSKWVLPCISFRSSVCFFLQFWACRLLTHQHVHYTLYLIKVLANLHHIYTSLLIIFNIQNRFKVWINSLNSSVFGLRAILLEIGDLNICNPGVIFYGIWSLSYTVSQHILVNHILSHLYLIMKPHP